MRTDINIEKPFCHISINPFLNCIVMTYINSFFNLV